MILLLLSSALAASPADELASYAADRCEATRVEVLHLGLPDPSQLASVTFEGNPCRGRPNLVVTTEEAGGARRRMALRPHLALYGAVPVAAGPAAQGQLVEVRHEERRLDQLSGKPFVGAGPWRARTDMRAGTPITARWAEPVPTAQNGADITVVTARGGLRIAANGRLLQDAAEGQMVRALVEATGAVVRGRLTNAKTVVMQ